MRLPALTAALATALAGTGCIVTTNDPLPQPTGILDLAWQFESSDRLLAGNFTSANSGCYVAAVTAVDVEVWDAWGSRVVFQTFPCEENGSGWPRAYLDGLAAGDYTYRLTAVRGSDPIFFYQTPAGYSVPVVADAKTDENVTLPVVSPAPLTVYFTQPAAACSGTPSIRLDVYRGGGAYVGTTTQPCDAVSSGITYPSLLATGSYEVDLFAINGNTTVDARCLAPVKHNGFPETVALVAPVNSGCGL